MSGERLIRLSCLCTLTPQGGHDEPIDSGNEHKDEWRRKHADQSAGARLDRAVCILYDRTLHTRRHRKAEGLSSRVRLWVRARRAWGMRCVHDPEHLERCGGGRRTNLSGFL